MEETTKLAIGLGVVGVVLVLVIVLGIIVVCWIVMKLRQLERDVTQDTERRGTNLTYANSFRTDSAIDLELEGFRSRAFSQASAISNARCIKARMTLVIQKEHANFYGKTPPLGQILMTAQEFYKAQTNKLEDIPIENVQVVHKDTNKREAVSKVLTADWREGTPTSLLFNADAVNFNDVLCQNKGIFIHRTIGPKGGNLNVSGVSVDIPAGALDEDRLISIGVCWDEKLVPVLTRKQTILSPIVLCQPSGLKFKVPVTLTFPHAAVRMTSDWIPKILKREGSIREGKEWEPVTLADYEERNVNDKNISLKLYHFTLYTCVAESKPKVMAAKLVHIVAFVGQLKKGSFFKPRVYCLNRYKDELEEAEMLLTRMDSSFKMADTTEIIVHDNEQDVIVDMVKLSPDWSLSGDRKEVLPFEHVWHAFAPHCTFVIKPKKSSISEVQCEITAFQNRNENCAAKLKIAENIPIASSPLSGVPEDAQADLVKELIILLDVDNPASTDAGNWKDLAEKVGCDVARIRWLEGQKQKSPTEILLEKWIEDKRTFEELEKVMLELHREDAAEEIRKRLKTLEQPVAPTRKKRGNLECKESSSVEVEVDRPDSKVLLCLNDPK